jgi:4-aminobutyrate aminotransferase/(S)-3-amino-2-methylpropionate transaminase
MLVVDEVQTGFARTGRMFGIEHSGIEPDLVAVAKSLAGGFPLAGVIGRGAILDAVEPGGLGGTYAGSPIACAAALAVLDVIAEEQLCARAETIGARVRERVAAFGKRNDLLPITGMRGLGAMVAFDVLKQRGFGEADGAAAKAVCARALEQGLIILNAGGQGETIRVLVPLTASDAIVEEGLDCLEAALRLPDTL